MWNKGECFIEKPEMVSTRLVAGNAVLREKKKKDL